MIVAFRLLTYAKSVQASAMKTCFQIAERSLTYAKSVQASAMKTCFQIAERSLTYAKLSLFCDKLANAYEEKAVESGLTPAEVRAYTNWSKSLHQPK